MAVCCCGCMLPCLAGASRGSKFHILSLVSNPSPGLLCWSPWAQSLSKVRQIPLPLGLPCDIFKLAFYQPTNSRVKLWWAYRVHDSMTSWAWAHNLLLPGWRPLAGNTHNSELNTFTYPPTWVGGMLSRRGLAAKRTFITTSDTVSSWSVSWVESSWDHDLWPSPAQVAHQSYVGNPVQTRTEHLNYSRSHHFKVWENNRKGTCGRGDTAHGTLLSLEFA